MLDNLTAKKKNAAETDLISQVTTIILLRR
jgi:hypothetical protein